VCECILLPLMYIWGGVHGGPAHLSKGQGYIPWMLDTLTESDATIWL
jgi:hypothetical protein